MVPLRVCGCETFFDFSPDSTTFDIAESYVFTIDDSVVIILDLSAVIMTDSAQEAFSSSASVDIILSLPEVIGGVVLPNREVTSPSFLT